MAGRRFLKNDSIRMQNNTKAAWKDEAIGVGEVVHEEAWEVPPGGYFRGATGDERVRSPFDDPLLTRSLLSPFLTRAGRNIHQPLLMPSANTSRRTTRQAIHRESC